MFYLSMIFLCLFGISVEGIAFQSIEDCEKSVSTHQRKSIIEIKLHLTISVASSIMIPCDAYRNV